MGKWEKGISGNPNGRPRKERTFTKMLERAGRARSNGVVMQRAFTQRIWGALDTGFLVFPDGRQIALDGAEYIKLTQFVFGQIDGPPKAEHEVDLNNASMTFIVQEGLPSKDDDDDSGQ